ncbi:MAG: hypothetical protein WBD87_08780 [Candidatus Acidiferrales bacterium]
MFDKPAKSPLLHDTNSGPLPGEFPVGSAESRAAARAMLQRAEKALDFHWVAVICVGAGPEQALQEPNFHTWDGVSDLWQGNMYRVIYAHGENLCAVCRKGLET